LTEQLEIPVPAVGAPGRVGTLPDSDSQRQIAMLSARVEELEAEKEAAESFAAVAAHELMAPLVMTEARVALAREHLDPDVQADTVRTLDELARDAASSRRLVEALLEEARWSDRPLQRVRIELDAVVTDCLLMLAPEIRARGARVDVEPLPEVRGNPDLIRALVTNLLVNALKFNRRHGGAICIRAASDGEWLTVFVADQAQPIPPADRDRIFLAFSRGRGERRARGAGLGLAICRRIVERHGGRIGVLPGEGGGNEFFFTLPAA
jgi:signal transduction histidine kinase